MNAMNRRRNNRVDVDWRARVGRRGVGVSGAWIRNISIGGMYLESERQFESGTNLLMEIQVAHGGEPRKILAEGVITRAQAAGSTAPLYGYGIRFRQIADADLHYLLAVVADLWSQSSRSHPDDAACPQPDFDVTLHHPAAGGGISSVATG